MRGEFRGQRDHRDYHGPVLSRSKRKSSISVYGWKPEAEICCTRITTVERAGVNTTRYLCAVNKHIT